jgi:hypothetical protein
VVIPTCASPRPRVTPKKKRKAETAAFMEVEEQVCVDVGVAWADRLKIFLAPNRSTLVARISTYILL